MADPATTGRVLEFRVVPATTPDPTTPAMYLQLPALVPLPTASVTRPLALIEKMGAGYDDTGTSVDGPVEALLGTADGGTPTETLWMDPVTENPDVGATEVWEFYNTTGDAHPMHVHEVAFEVVNRQLLALDPAPAIRSCPSLQSARHATGTMGDRRQGHGDCLSRTGHAHPCPVL